MKGFRIGETSGTGFWRLFCLLQQGWRLCWSSFGQFFPKINNQKLAKKRLPTARPLPKSGLFDKGQVHYFQLGDLLNVH